MKIFNLITIFTAQAFSIFVFTHYVLIEIFNINYIVLSTASNGGDNPAGS
jgi:hypothetical protein